MRWRWARRPRAVNRGGSSGAPGAAVPMTALRSTGPKRADLPLGETSTAFFFFLGWRGSSCQLLLFRREADFPKSAFFSVLIFRGGTGCDAGARAPNGGQRGHPHVFAEPRARLRGPTGTSGPRVVPPRRRAARSAEHSPEPSGPPSARRPTERKPRGTVNSTAPANRRARRHRALRLPRGTYWVILVPGAGLCTALVAGTGFAPPRVSPPARPQSDPTAPARSRYPPPPLRQPNGHTRPRCGQGTRSHPRSRSPRSPSRSRPGAHQMVHEPLPALRSDDA